MKRGKHAKESRFKNKKMTFFRLFLIIIIFICLIRIGMWGLENIKNKKLLKDVQKIEENASINIESTDINEIKKQQNEKFEKLKEINSDIYAYLSVPGTNINYPVVQTTNNDFYLTHSLDKSYNSAGWIFASYKNNLDGTDKNIVIFGHNRRDGTMFGSLKNILTEDWLNNDENKYITLQTEDEIIKYKIISVYQIKAEDYYIKTSFENENEYAKFIKTIKERSIKNFNVDVQTDDNIITLSTCANNNAYRVVLHAKK